MNCIDVFNGDADGICALHQLRLHSPRPGARLVTGLKRDITLLSRLLDVTNACITVLDISLESNRASLERLLDNGNRVFYADHHYSGGIPDSALLTAHLDPSPLLCTSLIIDRLLQGQFRSWAIAGAFGDNLEQIAERVAADAGFSIQETSELREIGTLLNYNGYGLNLEDLHVHPDALFLEVQNHPSPFDFFNHSALLNRLRKGFEGDMTHTERLQPIAHSSSGRVFLLPNENWAHRVIGAYSNQLARKEPELAHAILIPNREGSLRVSVRAPMATGTGADTLCHQFPTGGGRTAAAGINTMPVEMSPRFISQFLSHFAS